MLQEIEKKQKRGYAFKFQQRLKAFLEKFSFENNKSIKIDVWFPSNTYTVLDSIHIRKKINTAIRDIYKRYDSFVQRGSGWVLKKVSKFSVSIMKFKLFQGGCLSALLPRELHKKCCCVSIKNIPKNECFFYCVATALCENTKNKYRKSKQHDKIIELLPSDNMEGPVSIREIKYLEKNSCVSVNVYGYDKIPYPYYICRASARPPASQSTAPHFPSSMDGARNRKGSKRPRPSELDNRTPPAKSDTAQFGV